MITQQQKKTLSKPIIQKKDVKAIWHENPMEVLVMLFDKSLLHIGRARTSLMGWDDENLETHILNAIGVIECLQMTLEEDKNSTIAVNLNQIYRYVIKLLLDCLQEKKPDSLNNVTSLLMEIRVSLSVYVNKSSRMLQH